MASVIGIGPSREICEIIWMGIGDEAIGLLELIIFVFELVLVLVDFCFDIKQPLNPTVFPPLPAMALELMLVHLSQIVALIDRVIAALLYSQ